MNVEIGTDAAQFPEKEYLNGIFRCSEYEFATKIQNFPDFLLPVQLWAACAYVLYVLGTDREGRYWEMPSPHTPHSSYPPPIHVHCSSSYTHS